MNRALIERRCKELGIDAHTLAREASVDPFFLVDSESRRTEEGLPLAVLRVLSRILDVSLDDLVEAPARPTEQPSDDVVLEAAFAVAGRLCRDDIAHVFDWTLDRVERALAALEVRLRATGRRLHHVGWHSYTITAATSVLSRGELARLVDRKPCYRIIRRDDAEVLRLVIAGWTEKSFWVRPRARLSLDRLLGKGFLVDDGAEVAVSPDVRYSLRLDERNIEPRHGLTRDASIVG